MLGKEEENAEKVRRKKCEEGRRCIEEGRVLIERGKKSVEEE